MLSARILKVKELADEEGVQASEMANAEKLLKRYNITIRDSVGNMKPLQNILREFAPIYNNMSDAEQQLSSETLAGNRHRSTFGALMGSMTRETELYNEALNSEGVLMEANSKYTESINGKLGTLNATKQELYATMVNSNAFIVLIESATTLLQVMVNVTTMFQDNLPIALGITIGSVVALTMAIKGLTVANMVDWVVKVIASLSSYITVANLATIGTIALKVAVGGLIGLGIGVFVSLFTKGFKKMTASAKELADETKAVSKEISDMKLATSNADKLISQYDNLTRSLKDTRLSTEELRAKSEELNSVKSELLGMFPSAIRGYDEEGNAILANADSLKELNEIEKERAKEREKALKFEATGNYEAEKNRLEEHKRLKQEAFDEIAKLEKDKQESGYAGEDNFTLGITKQAEAIKALNEEIFASEDLLKVYEDVLGIAKNTTDGIANATNNFGKSVKDVMPPLSEVHGMLSDNESLENNFVRLGKELDTVRGILNDINKDGMDYSTMEKVLELFPDIGSEMLDVVSVQELLNERISDMEEAQLSAYGLMIANDEAYFENKIKNTSEWEKFTISVNENLAKVNNLMLNAMGEDHSKYFKNMTEAYNVDLSNCKTIAEARAKVESAAAENIARIRKALYEQSISASAEHGINNGEYHQTETSGKMFDAIGEITKWKNEALKAINAVVGVTTPNFSNIFGGGTGTGTTTKEESEKIVKDLEDIADRYYDIAGAIKDIDNALDLNRAKQEFAMGEEKLKLLEEEVGLLKEKQRLLAEQKTEMGKEASSLRQILSDSGFTFDDTGDISNYTAKLKELQDKANSKTGDDKEEYIKYVENLIDVIERYTELVDEEIPNADKEWQEYANEIKKLEREKLDYITNVQKQITLAYEHEMRKRTEAIKKELQKQKDLYNDQFNEEDYADSLSKEQNKLDQIQQEINNISRDTSVAGQLKLKQLVAEYEAQQEIINQMIRDKEKENGNEAFDNAMDEADKDLEEALSPENLAKVMNDALATGIIQIGDEVIKIDDLMSNWLDETGDGLYAVGNVMRSELIDSLKQASSLIADVGEGFKSISGINLGINQDATPKSGRSSAPSIEFNSPLLSIDNIEGDLGKGVMQQISSAMDKLKNDLEVTLARQLSMK